jgi:hypothetical protein
LWETFLLQMNDFDRLLELGLRYMLDPVVAARPPVRMGRQKRSQEPVLFVGAELAAPSIPTIQMVEPVVAVAIAIPTNTL